MGESSNPLIDTCGLILKKLMKQPREKSVLRKIKDNAMEDHIRWELNSKLMKKQILI